MAKKTFSKAELSRLMAQAKATAKAEIRAARVAEERKKKKAVAQAVLKKFRPRKDDVGKIVLVGLNGKRVSKTSGRKLFPIYVGKGKKKSFVPERGKDHRKQPPVPQFFRNLSLSTKKHKGALGRLYADAVGLKLEAPTLYPDTWEEARGYGVAFTKVAEMVKDILNEASLKHPKSRQFKLTFEFEVKEKDTGITHRFGFWKTWNAFPGQFISDDGLENFVWYTIYPDFAEWLKRQELVSGGSARHVARLKHNRGADEEEWTTSDDVEWSKIGFGRVEIQRVRIIPERQVFSNRKAKDEKKVSKSKVKKAKAKVKPKNRSRRGAK